MAGLVIITCFSKCLSAHFIISCTCRYRQYPVLWTHADGGHDGKADILSDTKNRCFASPIVGTGAGLVTGFAVSFLLIPAAVKALGIHKLAVEVSFHPAIFLGSIVLVGTTVFLCSRRPAKMAALASPAEAMGYRAGSPGQTHPQNGKTACLVENGREQLQRTGKKDRGLSCFLWQRACLCFCAWSH